MDTEARMHSDDTTDSDSLSLTPAAVAASPSERCWKCKGRGLKYQKSTQSHDGPPCQVCNGEGIRKQSKRSRVLASEPGKILNLRGYPKDHVLRTIFPEGFAGPRAVWGLKVAVEEDLPTNLRPREGEVVGSLGCGDWRIYQIADGNKLTVDDFVCAWVAAEEMRKQGYGMNLHRSNPVIGSNSDDDNNNSSHGNNKNGGDANADADNEGQKMFGGRIRMGKANEQKDENENKNSNHYLFNHADIGTGCGSVLMMTAWAFLGEIHSVGIEAQEVSFGCLKRGLEWNLGSDGTSPNGVVQVRHNDLRTWDGYGVSNDADSSQVGSTTTTKTTVGDEEMNPSSSSSSLRSPYHLITGTPPYFPLDSFVASQNHEQKVRCRVPTRGGAPNYIETASRFLLEEECNERDGTTAKNDNHASPPPSNSEGVFCMVEAAFDKAEAGVLAAVKKFNMRVRRRVDVVTRVGLPPRFSCWVMTKKNASTIKKVTATVGSHINNNDADEILVETSGENKEGGNSNDNGSKISIDTDTDKFPIETLTLRNADLTRTKEYTNAMEIMGWVDFEKSKSKTAKTLTQLESKEDNANSESGLIDPSSQ